MSYEIPQQLEHKEALMWGLHAEQLLWVGVFGLPALYLVGREELGYLRFWLMGIPVIFAIIFMFFEGRQWLTRLFLYVWRRIRQKKKRDYSAVLGVSKLHESVIHTHRECAVLEVFPVNFRIKGEQERTGIITAYQKLLNSFDYPVQILITTQDLDLDKYLTDVGSKTKDKTLFEGFKTYMTKYAKEHKMQNRRFFVVIPKVTELNIQVQVLSERLTSMGLLNKRLSTNQILHLFRMVCNSTSTDADAKSLVHVAIGLKSLEPDLNFIKVNGKFCRIFAIKGYPRSVESGFLDKIISSEGDFDITIHIEPYQLDSMIVKLNRELQKQRADLYAEEKRGSVTPSLEIKASDTRRMLEELQKGEEKFFQVAFHVCCKADSLESLNLLSKRVESELNSLLIVPTVPQLQQLEAFISLLPTLRNPLGIRRNVGTKALSAFFPFTSPFMPLDQTGVMLGLNRNNVPLVRDIFALSNPNGMVLATSGAGKSYFTKLLILRQIMAGTRVIIIDPQAEYLDLVSAYKGQIVTISKDSDSIINPLDPMGHDILEKRLALMDMFRLMFGELSDVQKSILDKAVTDTYTRVIRKNARPPRMGDLYETLKDESSKAKNLDQYTYGSLLNRIQIFTSGVFQFLNKNTNLDLKSAFICFNIGNMPKQVKPLVMFLILDYVYMKMKSSRDPKLLVIDEAWSLLSQTEEASYIFEIVKTCRKFNMGLLLITQDVADLVNSKAGHAVLANSSYTLLLRQKPAIIDSVVKTFSLSQHEKEYLLSAEKGSGIFIADNDHQEIKIIASPQEHKLITTNPNEKKAVVEKKEEEKKYEPYYYVDDLGSEQILELENAKFKSITVTPLGTYKKVQAVVKKDANSGEVHTYYVQSLARYILDNGGIDVRTPSTRLPDVIFKNKFGQEFYVEVEAPNNIRKNRKDKIKKFGELELNYPDRTVILVVDYLERGLYQTITNLPLILQSEIFAWVDSCLSHKK